MYESAIDEQYLTWLYSQVAPVNRRRGPRTYWGLLRQMHDTIFVAIVARDENRIADAKDLREVFLAEEGVPGDLEWSRSPGTMLELLIALAKHLSFETEDPVDICFWEMVESIGLDRFNDHAYDTRTQEFIAEALERVIYRTYEPNGHGGLFPLKDHQRDQRTIELWYQLNAYLLEQY